MVDRDVPRDAFLCYKGLETAATVWEHQGKGPKLHNVMGLGSAAASDKGPPIPMSFSLTASPGIAASRRDLAPPFKPVPGPSMTPKHPDMKARRLAFEVKAALALEGGDTEGAADASQQAMEAALYEKQALGSPKKGSAAAAARSRTSDLDQSSASKGAPAGRQKAPWGAYQRLKAKQRAKEKMDCFKEPHCINIHARTGGPPAAPAPAGNPGTQGSLGSPAVPPRDMSVPSQEASVSQPSGCGTTTSTESLALVCGQQLGMQGSPGSSPAAVRRRRLTLPRKQAPTPIRKKTSASHSAGMNSHDIARSPVPAIVEHVSEQQGSADPVEHSDFSMQAHGSLPTGADCQDGMLSRNPSARVPDGQQHQQEPQGALPRRSASAAEIDSEQQQQQKRVAADASHPITTSSAQAPAAQEPGSLGSAGSPASIGSQDTVPSRSPSAEELEGQQQHLQGPATSERISRTSSVTTCQEPGSEGSAHSANETSTPAPASMTRPLPKKKNTLLGKIEKAFKWMSCCAARPAIKE